jgi:hypothetical protein
LKEPPGLLERCDDSLLVPELAGEGELKLPNLLIVLPEVFLKILDLPCEVRERTENSIKRLVQPSLFLSPNGGEGRGEAHLGGVNPIKAMPGRNSRRKEEARTREIIQPFVINPRNEDRIHVRADGYDNPSIPRGKPAERSWFG